MKITFSIFIMLTLSYFSYENGLNPNSRDKKYITKFNMEGMRKKHLPDFELVRKRSRQEGREFVFDNLNDTTNLFIRVGIFSSKEKA